MSLYCTLEWNRAGGRGNNVTIIRLGHDGMLEVVDLGSTWEEVRSAVPRASVDVVVCSREERSRWIEVTGADEEQSCICAPPRKLDWPST